MPDARFHDFRRPSVAAAAIAILRDSSAIGADSRRYPHLYPRNLSDYPNVETNLFVVVPRTELNAERVSFSSAFSASLAFQNPGARGGWKFFRPKTFCRECPEQKQGGQKN